MSNEDKSLDLGRSPADSSTHRLLRNLGKLIPETADDVRRAEEELAEEPCELPEALKDADRVFEGSLPSYGLDASSTPPSEPDADVLSGFSAAAREGRGLTPEVKEQMRRDWNEARRTREEEDGDHGSGDRGTS